MTSKQFLGTTGLEQILQSVIREIANRAQSVFKTDSNWEVTSLSVLEGWVSGNTATDTINSRTVNNYDVYLVTDTNAQYYFDSGTWLAFAPDLTNYFTKGESDARYPTMADFADINLAVSPVVIPAKLAGYRQVIEAMLTLPLFGLITAVQSTTVTVQFSIGNNTGTATLPYEGAMATAAIGKLVHVERKWDRTSQGTTVTYTLNPATSRCFTPGAGGVPPVDNLTSTSTSDSLSANQGRILAEMIEAATPESMTTATINAMLVAAGFPAIENE